MPRAFLMLALQAPYPGNRPLSQGSNPAVRIHSSIGGADREVKVPRSNALRKPHNMFFWIQAANPQWWVRQELGRTSCPCVSIKGTVALSKQSGNL